MFIFDQLPFKLNLHNKFQINKHLQHQQDISNISSSKTNMKSGQKLTETFKSQLPHQPVYSMFRGQKRKVSQLNKTKLLKTKHLGEKRLRSVKYDSFQRDLDQQDILTQWKDLCKNNEEDKEVQFDKHKRTKSLFQMGKSYPLQRIQKMKQNLSSSNHNLMIKTSKMKSIFFQQTNRQVAKENITLFYSKNLQVKMNQYLNMVVAKSSSDHKQKLKQLNHQEQQKHRLMKQNLLNQQKQRPYHRNRFLREFKIRMSLNKKCPNTTKSDLLEICSHNFNKQSSDKILLQTKTATYKGQLGNSEQIMYFTGRKLPQPIKGYIDARRDYKLPQNIKDRSNKSRCPSSLSKKGAN